MIRNDSMFCFHWTKQYIVSTAMQVARVHGYVVMHLRRVFPLHVYDFSNSALDILDFKPLPE